MVKVMEHVEIFFFYILHNHKFSICFSMPKLINWFDSMIGSSLNFVFKVVNKILVCKKVLFFAHI